MIMSNKMIVFAVLQSYARLIVSFVVLKIKCFIDWAYLFFNQEHIVETLFV